MRHIAAYLLATLGGNDQPSAADIKKILSSVGVETDNTQLESLLDAIGGNDINKLISDGLSKLATVPTGGAVSAEAAAPDVSSGGKKEEPKKAEQKKEESDEEMGFGLFD